MLLAGRKAIVTGWLQRNRQGHRDSPRRRWSQGRRELLLRQGCQRRQVPEVRLTHRRVWRMWSARACPFGWVAPRGVWSPRSESNRRPAAYKAAALAN